LLPDGSLAIFFEGCRNLTGNCFHAGAAISKRNHGVIDKTNLEIQAIKAAGGGMSLLGSCLEDH
jgi:hypothetical protein